MNVGIRRVGIAIMVVVPRTRRAAHVSPGRRQQEARRRPAQRAEVPRRSAPAARRDRHLRRLRRREVGADQRRVPLPARLPGRHRQAVRAGRRVPVDPVRIGRRREHVLVGARRARTSASLPRISVSSSSGQPITGTVVLTLSLKAQLARGCRARRPPRLGRGARRAHRRRRRDVLEPHLRSERCSRRTT